MYNEKFEIIFFNDYFVRFRRNLIQATYPMFLKNTGGSLWLRKLPQEETRLGYAARAQLKLREALGRAARRYVRPLRSAVRPFVQ